MKKFRVISISGETIDQHGSIGSAGAGKDEVAKIFTEKGFIQVCFADAIKRFLAEMYDWKADDLWGTQENKETEDKRYKLNNSDKFLTPRLAAQTLGESMRSVFQDTWAALVGRVINRIRLGYSYDPMLGIINCSLAIVYPGQRAIVNKDLYAGGFESYIENRTLLNKGETVKVIKADHYNTFIVESDNGRKVCVSGMDLQPIKTKPAGVIVSDCRHVNEIEYLKNHLDCISIKVRRKVEKLSTEPNHISEVGLSNIGDSYYEYVIDNDGTLLDLKNKVEEIYSQIEQW